MRKKQPNIIIFNPDQWRSDVMGHMGDPAVQTPNLDAFAKSEAVSFRNAFCQNPVCTPSRCSFMTGLYPHVRGHRTMHHMLHLEKDEPNLLSILKEHGYFIWWGGKNDLTPAGQSLDPFCDIKFQPTEEDYKRWGFEHQEGSHGGDLKWRNGPEDDNYFSFLKGYMDKKDKDIYFDHDWAMIFGALDFIKNYNGDQPYCIFLPIGYPHPPYCVEEPWYSLTDRNKIPERIVPPENYNGKPMIMKGIAENQKMHNWTEDKWAELKAVYYGMCSRVDDQFGRLCKALKDLGEYDNSAVFFFSDHGDYTGDYGIVEKTQNTFEDCLSRIPFIIKPPKDQPVAPGIRDELTELIDFPATVFDLLDINPGYDHFGKSLLPIIKDKNLAHRDAAFCEGGRRMGEKQAMEWQSLQKGSLNLYSPRVSLQNTDEVPYHGKGTMCRTQKYKYIKRLYESDELYDLEKDPDEVTNLIEDPEYATVLIKMKERLLTWYQETCDIVPQNEDDR